MGLRSSVTAGPTRNAFKYQHQVHSGGISDQRERGANLRQWMLGHHNIDTLIVRHTVERVTIEGRVVGILKPPFYPARSSQCLGRFKLDLPSLCQGGAGARIPLSRNTAF